MLTVHRSTSSSSHQSSTFVTFVGIVCVIGLLPFVDASCQRISVVDSSMLECTDDANSSCSTIHTVTATMSELRRDLCIRRKADSGITSEIQLHLQYISMMCNPVVLYYTRNIQFRTLSVKRCGLAGSCMPNFCEAVSSRTSIPELEPHMSLPGISRCSESCGGYGCGCLLPLFGCLFSRTVADLLDDYVYEVLSCPTWNVHARFRYEETRSDGSKTNQIVSIRQQSTIPAGDGTSNITLDFVASPPLPILSSLFIRRMRHNATEESTGVIVPAHSEIALRCSTKEAAASPTACFLQNTCTCAPSPASANCDCSTTNITSAMDSLDHRLPVTTPDVAVRLVNGFPTAVSHKPVAEITVFSRHSWNHVVQQPSRCIVRSSEVTGCFNCLVGATATVTCTADVKTIATLICLKQEFAVSCSPTEELTKIRLFSSSAKFDDTCMISCMPTNVSLVGILTYQSLWNDKVKLEEQAHFVNFIHLPNYKHIWEIAQAWWKTSLITFLLLVVAVGVTLTLGPLMLERAVFPCLVRRPAKKIL